VERIGVEALRAGKTVHPHTAELRTLSVELEDPAAVAARAD
jgi:peptide/nickel transport system ATP-binding protein